MPKMDLAASLGALGDTKFYKGGFDAKMDKREAALILGVSPMAPKLKIKEAHKRIMLINHPDRGGSPYIASKINEGNIIIIFICLIQFKSFYLIFSAKDILDAPKKSFN